jgi:hypothetical protein
LFRPDGALGKGPGSSNQDVQDVWVTEQLEVLDVAIERTVVEQQIEVAG